MGETDLTKRDWQDCRAAAVASIRNCKAQLIVYENQLMTADAEISKFPEEPKPEVKTEEPK